MPVMPKIGLDLDGVIIDHTDHKLKLARKFGYRLEPWQVNANVMKRFVGNDDYIRIQEEMYGPMTPAAPPMAGALEYLSQLQGELCVISARRADTVRYAQIWLDQHRIYDVIPAERIFFCGANAEKCGIADRLGVNIFMDDQLRVLTSMPYGCRRVLYDAHGAAEEIHPEEGICIVNSWEDFLNLTDRRQAELF